MNHQKRLVPQTLGKVSPPLPEKPPKATAMLPPTWTKLILTRFSLRLQAPTVCHVCTHTVCSILDVHLSKRAGAIIIPIL